MLLRCVAPLSARASAAPCPPNGLLTGLHSLDLSRNKFTHLPPALSAATALTCLTLNGNSMLRLRAPDAAVLLALPRLHRLEIEGIAAAAAAAPAALVQFVLAP